MKFGIMSDTHGYIEQMQGVLNAMSKQHHVDTIIHLGDDMADLEACIIDDHVSVVAVPGLYEPNWHHPHIDRRQIITLKDRRILISHTPTKESGDSRDDIDPSVAKKKLNVDIFLHGHTHHPTAYRREDNLIVINPGHLKGTFNRGVDASYAIGAISDKGMCIDFMGLSHERITQTEFIF